MSPAHTTIAGSPSIIKFDVLQRLSMKPFSQVDAERAGWRSRVDSNSICFHKDACRPLRAIFRQLDSHNSSICFGLLAINAPEATSWKVPQT